MKLSCFWHVRKYITDRYKFMSVEEQKIWAVHLDMIDKELRVAYEKGFHDSPVHFFIDFPECEQCQGCVDCSDEVE